MIDCRPCLPTDDFGAVALCLYQTDPYIYPHLCNGDKESALSLLTQCISLKSNVFYYENLIVAEAEGKIVGVICAISYKKTYSFLDGLTVPEKYLPFVRAVNKGYFLPLFEETRHLDGENIVNVCTLDTYRKKGVGSALLGYYLQRVKDAPVYLDVIADNASAIRLYEKYGFRLVEERNGYEPSGAELPCYLLRKQAE